MSQPTETSAFGPVIFAGLTLYMLVTAGPVPPPENPAERMDMAVLAKSGALTGVDSVEPMPLLPAPQHIARISRPSAPFRPRAELLARALPAPQRPALLDPTWQPSAPGLSAPALLPATLTTPPPVTTPNTGNPPVNLPQTNRNASRPATPRAGARPQSDPTAQALTLPGTPDSAPRLPRFTIHVLAPSPSPLARPMAPPIPAAHPANESMTIQGTTVHLRVEPNARSQVISRLDTGAQAIAIERRGNWTRVYFPEATPPITGWVYSDYLNLTP